MLKLSTSTVIPSVNETVSILTAHTETFGVPMDYDRLCEYYAYYTLKADRLSGILAQLIGIPKLNVKDATIISYLNGVGVTTGLLLTKKGKRVSVSSDSLQSAIDTGLYKEETVQVMKMYAERCEYLHAVSLFSNIIQNHKVKRLRTWDGHRLIMCKPEWVPQNTGRIGAREPAIMNIKKALNDISTVPEGFLYLEVDSGQIDPRISQSIVFKDQVLKNCTIAYNDAYYGYLHYCLWLNDQERLNANTVIKPHEITDEMAAKRKNLKTYGNAVMYGSTENEAGDPDKAAFIKYIGSHHNRIKLVNNLTNSLEHGNRVFYTPFGTPIDITKGPSELNYEDKSSKEYFTHLLNTALNAPIQGAAADLMRYSVKQADKFLQAEAAGSFIIKYTHDSGTFAIHEDDYEKVAPVLKEITSYQVDDWVPIYGEAVEKPECGSGVKRFIV